MGNVTGHYPLICALQIRRIRTSYETDAYKEEEVPVEASWLCERELLGLYSNRADVMIVVEE